jgi:hypothetical protein
MLYFHNPGELDIRLVSLFGVNVKPGESPIGYFGTGLKYAIAVTLRLGGSVTIHSGLRRFSFQALPTSIRDKEFQLVTMTSDEGTVQMPYTLELGKNWLPWQAYREFWSNAKDEGGGVTDAWTPASPGQTVVEINCQALTEAHTQRHTFLLASRPIWYSSKLEVHLAPSKTIFYRGVKVYEADKLGCFTYNLLDGVTLTEDRTANSWYSVSNEILRGLSLAPHAILSSVLLAGENRWEWEKDWDLWWGNYCPPDFKTCVETLAQSQRFKLPKSVSTSFLPKIISPPVKLTTVQQSMLDRSLRFCSDIAHTVQEEIVVVESLGASGLGTVLEGKIVLSLAAFHQGTAIVAGTLLEEHIHAKLGLPDGREMQNYLLNLVVGLGQELVGSPL